MAERKILPSVSVDELEPEGASTPLTTLDDRGWSDSERTLLLQSVLVGKAQEAFIALSVPERKMYKSVKDAVLKSVAKEQSRGRADPDACHYCLEKGHWKNECPVLRAKGQRNKSGTARPVALAVSDVRARPEFIHTEIKSNSEGGVASNLSEDSLVGSSQYSGSDVIKANVNDYSSFITDGFVSLVGSSERVPVKILRDTGACESFLLESVLPFSTESSIGHVLVRGIGLQVVTVPLHRIELQSDLVRGEVAIAVRHSLPVDGVHLILGNNLAGERVWRDVPPPVVVKSVPSNPSGIDCSLQTLPEVFTACAVTRAMNRVSGTEVLEKNRKPDLQPIVLPDLPSSLSISDFAVAQKEDSTLSELFAGVLPAEEQHSAARGYFVQDGLLVRKWMPQTKEIFEDPVFQIVVPVKFRDLILQTAHGDIAGHLGVRKMYDRLMKYFYWPCLKKDVACFIKTCHTCQLTGKPNQVIKPAPLYPIPVLGNPFEHLLIDCVGPLPPSKSGCVYLLTVMYQATRYPAAYALRTISTKSVVKALSQFISIFGIPQSIQSDRGSNFTSHMFSEVLKQLHVKHHLSSAYHAQSQGSLERFHQTLKSLLRGYCVQLNKDWEEGLPWLLLAAREVTQESTGFSPNDLVFSHRVRGPLAVLQDKLKCPESPSNLLEYVNGFRRKLFLACEMAVENLTKAQKKMKSWYDRRAEQRVFSPGDQVLALLPIAGSPFLAKFTGPYTVIRQVSDLNYLVSTPDRRRNTQLCHINLLKPYYSRSPVSGAAETGDQVKSVALAAVAGISSVSPHMVAACGEEDVVIPDDGVLQPRLKNSEKLSNLDTLLGHLSKERALAVESLICNFPALFSDTPSCTHLIKHDIDVGDFEPIRQRFYRVSLEKQQHLEAEVKYLLDNGLAEPSYSSWASPCILVSKPDGTYRFCTDYRKLNNITKPDSFPLPRVEDCVDRVGSARFVSKFDLLKGYYQVPLTSRAQEVSAFITPSGLYSYSVMSFGLRNAPATFQRLMNRIVSGLQGCAVYLDDVVVYSDGAPRMDQSFQMQVDASHVGAGAVLLQRDEQGELGAGVWSCGNWFLIAAFKDASDETSESTSLPCISPAPGDNVEKHYKNLLVLMEQVGTLDIDDQNITAEDYKNFTQDNRTQGIMEKSQWDLKKIRFQRRRLTRMDDYVQIYQRMHDAQLREYEDTERSRKKSYRVEMEQWKKKNQKRKGVYVSPLVKGLPFKHIRSKVERKADSNDDQVYVEPKTPEKTKEKRKVERKDDPSKHASAGPLWVSVGFLWDSVGKGKPFGAPCGLAEGKPTVGFPTETPQGPLKTHKGPQWVSPCGAHGRFAHLGPHEGLLWATHCGFAHRKPTRARSGLAHAGPIADLPIWAPMRVYCGQPTVGLPTENPHGLAVGPDLDAIHTQYMTKEDRSIDKPRCYQFCLANSVRIRRDAVTKSSQATACDVEASMKTWLRNPWDRDGGRQGRARTAEIPTVSPEGIDF
ncbi:gag-pol fusion protein [Pimephales promelas]|nr:gag-pol fusion protein [Pimephales promelas]